MSVFDVEYRKFKGSPEDLNFKVAPEDIASRCKNAETYKRATIPGDIIAIVFCVCLFFYLFTSTDFEPIVRFAPLVFVLIAVLKLIFDIRRYRRSDHFEIAEGVLVSTSEVNKRRYVSVWCEKDQIYLPRVLYCSVFHYTPGLPLYVVRGSREDGKKPRYFAISLNPDPLV